MVGSSLSGQTVPFNSPFALGGQNKASPKRLSCVPEEQHVYARLYYTVIGPGSWQLAEDIADTAKEIYPTLQSKNRWSTAEEPADDSQEQDNPWNDGMTDDIPPFSIKVFFNEDERSTAGSKWAEPRDHPEEDNHTRVFSIMQTLSAASRSTTSLGSAVRQSLSRVTRISTVHAEPAKVEKQVAAMSYFPVEKESEEMKPCRSLERWKNSCALLLLDPRQDEEHEDFMSELTKRRQEVQKWMMLHLQRHSLCGAPPLIAVVMINGTNQSEHPSCHSKSEDSHSLESKDENGHATCQKGAESLENDKYMAFVDDVRSMFNTPEGECIHRFVNFDDPAEVLRCHVTLAATIVDARKKHAAQALVKEDPRPDDGTTKQASCCRCAVM